MHTIGLSHDYATRNGRVFDPSTVLVFQIRDGRVSEVRQYFEDTAENDQFWS
jgi:ketosteroid isomerase-like protein